MHFSVQIGHAHGENVIVFGGNLLPAELDQIYFWSKIKIKKMKHIIARLLFAFILITVLGITMNRSLAQEIGLNDFRISFMGGTGDEDFDANDPDIAYNPTTNQYLVVWSGDEEGATLVDNEFEIFGQILNTDGSLSGSDFRISDMGSDGLPQGQADNFKADQPAVVYNSVQNNFLVVWRGEDDTGDLVDRETEIYGQLISSTGAEIGPNDFRISQVGVDGDISRGASNPAVSYNPTQDEFLVVWEADDTQFGRLDGAPEIYGQRINAMGEEIGAQDFNISNTGPDDSRAFSATRPSVAYNPIDDNYLVTWSGRDVIVPNADIEFEIYGQFLSAVGEEIGEDDFRISFMGSDGDNSFAAFGSDIAFNTANKTYLVVWSGDDDTGDLVDQEFEIFGQLLQDSGSLIGTKFRISDMGPDGDEEFAARDVRVTYSSGENEFLVVWQGDDDTGDLIDGDQEIFAQHLSAEGEEIGENDFRISDMGPSGNAFFDAEKPAVTYNLQADEFLVVWEGQEEINGLVDNEEEIFGQFIDAKVPLPGEFVINDTIRDVDPAVAYNSVDDTYFVVWSLVSNIEECEIFGQLYSPEGVAMAPKIRISTMGPESDARFQATSPSVAYNAVANNFLVVWSGEDDAAPLVDNEFEIYGQLVDANGAEIGPNDFRISSMGTDGDRDFDALNPRVVYNSSNNQFLVVWNGDDNTGELVDNEFEVYGQRIDAAGLEIGPDDFRISEQGIDGNTFPDATVPDVAYNQGNNQFMVVWEGELAGDSLATNIFAQRLGANGSQLGQDFTVSELAKNASIAYNSQENNFLVCSEGFFQKIIGQLLDFDGTKIGPDQFLIDNDVNFFDMRTDAVYNNILNHYVVVWSQSSSDEIVGQRISASGQKIGIDGFQISDVQSLNNADRAFTPQIAFGEASNHYMVVMETNRDVRAVIDNFCPQKLTDISLGSPITSGIFLAGESIISSGLIESDSDVSFDATGFTLLLPNFEVEQGALLNIDPNGCGN